MASQTLTPELLTHTIVGFFKSASCNESSGDHLILFPDTNEECGVEAVYQPDAPGDLTRMQVHTLDGKVFEVVVTEITK